MRPTLPLLTLAFGVLGYAAIANPPGQQPDRKIDFDRDVMPIISQRCFKCHGPDAAQAAGGLRLDSFEGATKDGVIVAGSAEKSYLITRVSAPDPADRMPPQDSGVKPLTPEQISILRAWIDQGAKYEEHWSYVAPVMPKSPSVSNPAWCRNILDRFVLAKLDAAGMKPEPEADKDTLALRAAQTLTGLPPEPAELARFRADRRSDAYERYVDRLLASPEYGEHEARYWLDAVRYGDTHGLQLDNERGVFPYRDWVVRAFNEDLPYDQFTTWQLAGDLLPNPTTEQLIATGYVRMNLTTNEGGAIPEEFLARNTFDRVDTTSTVFMGLTVQCAKCHDHKYDPIKQRDYYGLYAFFNSTKDDPLDGNITLPPPVMPAPDPQQDAQLKALGGTLDRLRSKIDPKRAEEYLAKNRLPVPAARDWQISPVYTRASFSEAFDAPAPEEPGQPGQPTWKPLQYEAGKDATPIVGKDNSAVYVRATVNVKKSCTITFGVRSDDGVRIWLNGKLIHSNKVSRGIADAVDLVKGDFKAGDNELIVKITNGGAPDGMNISLVDVAQKRIDDALAAYQKTPADAGAANGVRSMYLEFGPATGDATLYRKTLKARAELQAAIPMSLIAQEMPEPRPTFILKRGDYSQKGDPVVRHVPAILGKLPADAKPDRLSFAHWLTSPNNPLFARVFVNRIWQQHFGTGIVKTVEDFGSQGEWPLNRELLDCLAVTFQKDGWSVKKLNRLIVTSAAFRQSSRITPEKLAKDPENRLISRGPRFRLDAEVIRDKALFASGLLVEQLGGHGFKPYQPAGIWENASDPASSTHIYKRDTGEAIYRRSLYMFWKRTAPPPAMLSLDAPLRDTCIVRRPVTNTPLQALTLENETAFLEASRVMAERVMKAKGDDKRLAAAFEIAMARAPRDTEIKLLKDALAKYRKRYSGDPEAAKKLLMIGDAPQAAKLSPTEQAAWMLICSTLMNTDEFLSQH